MIKNNVTQILTMIKKIRLVIYNMEINLKNQACNLQHGN